MGSLPRALSFSRRRLLLGAAATCLPFPLLAASVYTPHELREQYAREVLARLHPPADEARLYGGIAELELFNVGQELLEPQYLMVIDVNPNVQAALLFWRLLPGSYELVGASPVSTLIAGGESLLPQGLFEQARASADAPCEGLSCGRGAQRVYDFDWRQRGDGFGLPVRAHMHLQVRAADRQAERRLGAPCSDGCILAPSSLIAFLDDYGVLDDGVSGRVQRHVLPCRGRHLMLVDSERDDRPGWSPAPPEAHRTLARASR
jgi:hypothetical protein